MTPPEVLGVDDDTVVALPDLVAGRLADLLAAAGGPAQPHELRGELAARTAFRAAADSWPAPGRRLRLRRGPAVVAATTIAGVLVATGGLAAASVLPGSAGRAVDGFLGSVGVDVGPSSTPAAPAALVPSGSTAVSAPALAHTGSVHVGCTTGGSDATGAAAGTVGRSSCALNVPVPARSHTVTSSTPAAAAPAESMPTPSAPPTKSPGVHHSGSESGGTTTPPTTLPGGGTSRGGNQGTGGGGCHNGSGGSTTTTTTSTDPSTTTTTTTTTPRSGCGKGHHGAGGQTGSGASGS